MIEKQSKTSFKTRQKSPKLDFGNELDRLPHSPNCPKSSVGRVGGFTNGESLHRSAVTD